MKTPPAVGLGARVARELGDVLRTRAFKGALALSALAHVGLLLALRAGGPHGDDPETPSMRVRLVRAEPGELSGRLPGSEVFGPPSPAAAPVRPAASAALAAGR